MKVLYLFQGTQNDLCTNNSAHSVCGLDLGKFCSTVGHSGREMVKLSDQHLTKDMIIRSTNTDDSIQ